MDGTLGVMLSLTVDDGRDTGVHASEQPSNFRLQPTAARMCLAGRFISRVVIPAAVDTYQLVQGGNGWRVCWWII
jgi:hypothetical protein